MTQEACMKFIVSGRVQGVWFRASTRDEAARLGLTGWAKNLSDGRVEVVACGPNDALNDLYEWLLDGPRLADVNDVSKETLPFEKHQGFETY